MNLNLSAEGKQALFTAFYEYFLVTSPVGLYVSLEALHKSDWHFLWESPEWAIAIIFLAFQGLSLYRQGLKRTGRKISEPLFGLLALFALIIIIAASINAFMSLHENTHPTIAIKVGLFVLMSASFILMVGGSKLAYLQIKGR